jgi:hypothetical protein
MSNRQSMIFTVPCLKFDSLQDRNLTHLEELLRRVVQQVKGTTLILDVTVVRSAGARFLTEVNRFALALARKQVQLVIAGELEGLFRLAGWQRRFRLYPSLVAAVLAWSEWRLGADSVGPDSPRLLLEEYRPGPARCTCQPRSIENEHPA